MKENNQSNLNNKWEDLTITEEQKHKKSIVIKILISILVISLIAGGVFFSYKKFFDKKDNVEITDSKNDKKEEEKENKEEQEEESSPKQIKIDNDKEYVYDAEYKVAGLKESYMYFETRVNLSDIVVPYLNVNTPAASEINKEIKDLFDEFTEMYDMFSKSDTSSETDGSGSFDYIKSNYTYTINNDIISILIKVNRTGRGSSEAEEYYTYNYDLKSEKSINLEDICKSLNLNYKEALNKVNEDIENTFENTFELESIPTEEEKAERAEYIKLNKEKFNNDVNNNKVKFYIDENNKLNIVVLNEHPFGGCGFYSDFVTITK